MQLDPHVLSLMYFEFPVFQHCGISIKTALYCLFYLQDFKEVLFGNYHEI